MWQAYPERPSVRPVTFESSITVLGVSFEEIREPTKSQLRQGGSGTDGAFEWNIRSIMD